MRPILIILFFMLIGVSAKSQKWQSGYFYDIKGNKETGYIHVNPSGKAPVKDEAFIEFKDGSKSNPFKLSASELKGFVIGRDSFVVAAEPRTSSWKNYLDFVQVKLDVYEIKLYEFKGGGGGGIGVQPDFGAGIGAGTGGSGGGVGAGISIPIGGGGGGGSKTVYYYGANTAEMKELTPLNFVDIMSDIMGDYDEVVQQIHDGKYNLNNIEKLIAYFNKVKSAHAGQ